MSTHDCYIATPLLIEHSSILLSCVVHVLNLYDKGSQKEKTSSGKILHKLGLRYIWLMVTLYYGGWTNLQVDGDCYVTCMYCISLGLS